MTTQTMLETPRAALAVLRSEWIEFRELFRNAGKGIKDDPYVLARIGYAETLLSAIEQPAPGPDAFVCEFSSVGNPDFGQYHGKGEGSPTFTVAAMTLADLVEIQQAYIAVYDLGGGNWTGGKIYRRGVLVAAISYNGRVWNEFAFGDARRKELDPETARPINE